MHKEVLVENITLYLGDCRDVLPTLGKVDAIVADPPYGIGEAAGKNKTRSRLVEARDYGIADWDDKPVSNETISLLRSCSKWQIIFGGNYYHLPPTSCWLVWDKINGNSDFADCELAWTNLPIAVRRIRFLWNGFMRRERHIERVHPTQKPVGVMIWCLEQLPGDARTICDPFMGSGTTGVACARTGRSFIGIEREPAYFDIACKRISNAMKQDCLFTADHSSKPTQQSLSL